MKAYVYGAAAIVTGTSVHDGTYEGHALVAKIVFTDTLIREDGAWKAPMHATKRLLMRSRRSCALGATLIGRKCDCRSSRRLFCSSTIRAGRWSRKDRKSTRLKS